MVGKLFKYEFKAQGRSLFLFQFIVLGIACMVRIVSLFKNDSVAYKVLSGSSIFFFVTACIACIVITFIMNVIRFYKNLYSAEGYLSFTLPVTNGQHIFVKNIVAFMFTLGSVAAVMIGICIAVDTDMLVEVFRAFGYTVGEFAEQAGVSNVVFYFIEMAFIVLIVIAEIYMKFYACLSIGQLVNRKRVLLAFGVYFGIYTLRQILGTIIIMLWSSGALDSILSAIKEYALNNITGAIHLGLCCILVYEIILLAVYTLLTYLPMKKKLNIE